MPIHHVRQLQGPYFSYVLGGAGGLMLTVMLLCLNFKRQNKRQCVSLQLPASTTSSMPISHGQSSVSTRSSHGPDEENIVDATIGSTIFTDSEPEIVVNDVGDPAGNTLKPEPDLLTTTLENGADHSAYAEVTGLNLDIQVQTDDSEGDGPSMKRGSLRGSIHRNSQKSKKKDKRGSLPASVQTGTLTPGSEQGDYASVTSLVNTDLPADLTAECDAASLRSSRGSVKSQAGRNSQRGKRKASATLPQAPQMERCAYVSVTPALGGGATPARDAQPPPPPSSGEADDVSLRSRGSVRGSMGRRDRSSLPANGTLPVAPSDYASVTLLSAPKSGDSEAAVEAADDHYAAVLRVNDDGSDPIVQAGLFVPRLHKSHSVGAYAQVDRRVVLNSREEGGQAEQKAHDQVKRLQTLPYDPTTQAQSYARPKKLNLSFDFGEGTPYAQPARPSLKDIARGCPDVELNGPDQDSPSSTPLGSPEDVATSNKLHLCNEVENPYAVPTPSDTRNSLTVESPYAQPAVPQKTPDALSLLSTDDLLSTSCSVSEDDR